MPDGLDWDVWLGPGAEAAVQPGLRAVQVARLLGFRHRRHRRHGHPQPRHRVLGARARRARRRVAVKDCSPALTDPATKETAPLWSIIELQFPARGGKPPVKMTWYDGGKLPPKELFQGEKLVTHDGGSLVIGTQGHALHAHLARRRQPGQHVRAAADGTFEGSRRRRRRCRARPGITRSGSTPAAARPCRCRTSATRRCSPNRCSWATSRCARAGSIEWNAVDDANWHRPPLTLSSGPSSGTAGRWTDGRIRAAAHAATCSRVHARGRARCRAVRPGASVAACRLERSAAETAAGGAAATRPASTSSRSIAAVDPVRRLLPVRVRRLDEAATPSRPTSRAGASTASSREDNQQFLWGILEDAARGARRSPPAQQKIGDYFAACMDEAAIEKRGAAPLDADARRRSTRSRSAAELPALLATPAPREHRRRRSCSASARTRTSRTPRRSSPFVDAGGLGLPDRDYYLKDDAQVDGAARRSTSQHVARMFELARRRAGGRAAARRARSWRSRRRSPRRR